MYDTRYFAGADKALGFGAKALNWWNKRSNAQKGAMIGAVGGAAIGGAKKGVKGALAGAAGGAAVGAGAGYAYGKWGKGALKNAFGNGGNSGVGQTSQHTDDYLKKANQNNGKSQLTSQKNRAIHTGESRIYGKGNQSDSMKRATVQGVTDVTKSQKTGMTRLGYGTDIDKYADQNKLKLSKSGDVITHGNGATYQKYVDEAGNSFMHQIGTGKFSRYTNFVPTKMFSKYFPVVKTYSNEPVKNLIKAGNTVSGGIFGAGIGALTGAGIGAYRANTRGKDAWNGAAKGAGVGALVGGLGGAGLGYYGGSKIADLADKNGDLDNIVYFQ